MHQSRPRDYIQSLFVIKLRKLIISYLILLMINLFALSKKIILVKRIRKLEEVQKVKT